MDNEKPYGLMVHCVESQQSTRNFEIEKKKEGQTTLQNCQISC